MKTVKYILALLMVATLPIKAQFGTQPYVRSTNLDAYVFPTGEKDIPYIDFEYTSCDAKKNKVRLSARVYYPTDFEEGSDVRNIFLACHPTVTDNWKTPTGGDAIDFKVARLAGVQSNHSLVLFPDYCGYGVSSHLQHPYLIHDVTAKNCIDAMIALFDEIDKRGWIVDENMKTHILGYSQGGATALACTKYLESKGCPQWVKDKVKLFETACGDGPYSAVATVNQYLEWGKPTNKNGGDDLEYACVLPLIVAAAKEAYEEGCMRTVKVEDYFTEEFLSSGVIDLIKSKGASTDVLAKAINGVMKRQRPVDVFSEKIINKETGEFNTTTNEYKCLMRALELGDLTIGWEPKHPIYFYHLENDKTVPYANTAEIFEEGHIGAEHSDLLKYIDPETANTGMNAAVYLFTSEVKNPDFANVNHSTGGIIFYADYMFASALRYTYIIWSDGLFVESGIGVKP